MAYPLSAKKQQYSLISIDSHDTRGRFMNEVVAQPLQANAEGLLLKQRITETKNVFYNTKKDFWQLTPATRNNKKRRVRQLVAQSMEGLTNFDKVHLIITEK